MTIPRTTRATTAARLCFAFITLGPLAACTLEPTGTDTEAAEVNAQPKLSMNDVSVLFPLPEVAEVDQLLSAKSSGSKGELLPEGTYGKIPRLVPGGVAREKLRVVSLRINPCDNSVGCKYQIRLILQPLEVTSGTVEAKDAAIHAFYTMSRDEFAVMATELVAARQGRPASRQTPLGPHPLLAEQGLGGVFARKLKGLVLEHTGQENLTRVTFMTREPPRRPQWKFGGFDIGPAPEQPHTTMTIASLGDATEQRFSTLLRNGHAEPAPRHADNVSLLFNSGLASAAPEVEIEKAYTATLRIQNPGLHSPDTVDCVSCHTASSARIWAEKNRGQTPNGNPATFTTSWNVSLTQSPSTERPDNLHAFGYLGTEVSISQRTANESAVVADYINTKILGRPR